MTETDMVAYYDGIASGYDVLYGKEQVLKLHAAWDLLKSGRFFENIVDFSSMSLLDVGCGTGISSDFFAELGFSVTGIDPSSGLIAENNTNLSSFACGFAEALPFENSSFDIVISFSAIQNFSDVKKGLEEMIRVGKDIFLLTYLRGTKKETLIRDFLVELFDIVEEIVEPVEEKDCILLCRVK